MSESFLSCQAVPFLVLGPEKADFYSGIFLSVLVGVSRLSASLVWDPWAKRKTNPGTSMLVIPFILRFLASLPSSLYLLSLLIFTLYVMSQF